MKRRFRLFRRGNYFWSHDGESGKQETLRTKDKATALRLLHTRLTFTTEEATSAPMWSQFDISLPYWPGFQSVKGSQGGSRIGFCLAKARRLGGTKRRSTMT